VVFPSGVLKTNVSPVRPEIIPFTLTFWAALKADAATRKHTANRLVPIVRRFLLIQFAYPFRFLIFRRDSSRHYDGHAT
jgi:hypothetical protein